MNMVGHVSVSVREKGWDSSHASIRSFPPEVAHFQVSRIHPSVCLQIPYLKPITLTLSFSLSLAGNIQTITSQLKDPVPLGRMRPYYWQMCSCQYYLPPYSHSIMSEILMMSCRQLLRESDVCGAVVTQVSNDVPEAHVFEHLGPGWGCCLGWLWSLQKQPYWEKYISGGMGFASCVWRKCDQLVSHSCYHCHAVPATGGPNSVTLTMSQNKPAPLEFALGGHSILSQQQKCSQDMSWVKFPYKSKLLKQEKAKENIHQIWQTNTWKLKQEVHYEFKDRLGFIVRPCLRRKKKEEIKWKARRRKKKSKEKFVSSKVYRPLRTKIKVLQ